METSESTVGQDPNLIWVKTSLKFQTQDGAWVGVEMGAWVPRHLANASIDGTYTHLEGHEKAIRDKRKVPKPH